MIDLNNTNIRLIFLIICALCTSACSSVMALEKKKGPDMTVARVGETRDRLILEMGEPVEAYRKDGKLFEAFEIVKSAERSVGRAVGHLAGNALTYGAWEIIAAPVEATQKSNLRFIVSYDREGRIDSIRSDRKNLSKYNRED